MPLLFLSRPERVRLSSSCAYMRVCGDAEPTSNTILPNTMALGVRNQTDLRGGLLACQHSCSSNSISCSQGPSLSRTQTTPRQQRFG